MLKMMVFGFFISIEDMIPGVPIIRNQNQMGCFRLTLKEGSHKTRIEDFSTEDQNEIY